MIENRDKVYDCLIIGGGASGTALLYVLSKYTDIANIALLEKYAEFGKVNSNSVSNSQSLHVGDIEMHYTRKKAEEVKKGALMIPKYLSQLSKEESSKIMTKVQKMALAVGEEEVQEMRDRHREFEGLFPNQRVLEREEIFKVEPNIVKDRNPSEKILALFDEDGHAIDYQRLSLSFVREAKNVAPERIDVFLKTKVENIFKENDIYVVQTNKGKYTAKSVVVNTDSYSLLFAKKMGLGKEYSLIPVGASFYFSREVLKGKVYPMQNRKLPFAGVHGDPDLNVAGKTRWGPTAKFYPVLESSNWATSIDYFKSAGIFNLKALKSLLKNLFDSVRFNYFVKSAIYDLPWIGKKLFVRNVQKIVPSMKANDLKLAKGAGGMRLQRVNILTGELELGEGKIIGGKIIFNMTPSPGASVCLYNGYRDAQTIVTFLNNRFVFDKEKMEIDLIE
jgi:malate dehydrogenase (quinone)